METLNWKTDNAAGSRLPWVNWHALQQYAIDIRRKQCKDSNHSLSCTIAPEYNMGGLHLVRLLNFNDGTKWVARIQLHECNTDSGDRLLHEVYTLSLIQERTKIPVPQVFAYESGNENPVGAAFMIMEFVPGSTAMDSFGGWKAHGGQIPPEYKPKFHRAIANIQTEMSSIRFPKIGMITKLEDGAYDIGPIPGLGGPFETASDYFEAWANHAVFPTSIRNIRNHLPSDIADEIVESIQQFPTRLKALAQQIPHLNTGPFPLYHTNFRHNNVIIDTDYNILSIIDWENASTVPWEVVEFPLFLTIIPFSMDAPWNYDSRGLPVDESEQQLWEDRREYIKMVREFEKERSIDNNLSTILASREIQYLATAIKLYLDPGKVGYYCKILDCFSDASAR